jgi:arabinose-5-phosphate isomerase
VEFDLDYARNVIEAEGEAIRAVSAIVDESFAKAVEMIYNCSSSVIISGIGKAGIIGRKISATLASTGTPSHFLHPVEAVHGDLGRVRKEDVVIVLSYGGETDEITRLINLVKQLEIKLIAITGDGDSTQRCCSLYGQNERGLSAWSCSECFYCVHAGDWRCPGVYGDEDP